MAVAQERGKAAERLAAAFLEFEGLEVVERNVRLGGVEVDLLARDGAAWVVVEVKARARTDYGGAGAAIDAQKRARLLRAARALLQERCDRVRIDVVAVEPDAGALRILHVRNAVTE